MNTLKLLDMVIEHDMHTYAYKRANARYKARTGSPVFLDKTYTDRDALTAQKAYADREKVYQQLYGVVEVLECDWTRLWEAGRILRHWYQERSWSTCPRRDLLDKLERYIMGD